jgi:hypothetical protein
MAYDDGEVDIAQQHLSFCSKASVSVRCLAGTFLVFSALASCSNPNSSEPKSEDVEQSTLALNSIPVYQDPTGNQTIAQPAGSRLAVNALAAASANNIVYVDGVRNPCSSAGFNAALKALPTTGGTVDGRGCQAPMTWTSDIWSGVTAAAGELWLGDVTISTNTTFAPPAGSPRPSRRTLSFGPNGSPSSRRTTSFCMWGMCPTKTIETPADQSRSRGASDFKKDTAFYPVARQTFGFHSLRNLQTSPRVFGVQGATARAGQGHGAQCSPPGAGELVAARGSSAGGKSPRPHGALWGRRDRLSQRAAPHRIARRRVADRRAFRGSSGVKARSP